MFVDEAISLLVTGGVGAFNTTIFASSNARIPVGDGPFLSVIATGGPVAAIAVTHNERRLPAYVDSSLQLLGRGASYPLTQAMLMTSLGILYPIKNQLVNNVWWLSVTPLQTEPVDLGQEEGTGRINLSLNFVIRRRPNAALSS